MESKDKMKGDELVSLNSELSSLFVEELEQRLETDPLVLNGWLLGVDTPGADTSGTGEAGTDCFIFSCGDYSYTCTIVF